MRIIAVIPARFGSKRFRGKPLVKIAGKTMIEWVYNRVESAQVFDQIIVATDDPRIDKEVKRFGAESVMTSVDHPSGTDRIWEVIRNMEIDAVVNIQGDEPLISIDLIQEIYSELKHGQCPVVTAVFQNNSLKDFNSTNIVKATMNCSGEALYFSRSPIPNVNYSEFTGFLHHVGIYGYTKNALNMFVSHGCSDLENKEKLEQLRFIENGYKIKLIHTDYLSVGVDVPSDVDLVEKRLREENA